jgi:uncharacterized protein (TIGR01777 family)
MGKLDGSLVVLAGGTGLVGQRLTTSLQQAGARVAVLSRTPHPADPAGGARSHPWEALPDLLREATAVVNLAGAGIGDRRWTARRKQVLRDSRTQTTARIVAAIDASGKPPEVLVNASAIGFYGNREEGPCDEGSPVGHGFLPELCSAWEAAAQPGGGVRTVHLRLGVVLAREGGALPRIALPMKCFAGAIMGTGRQGFSWIHIEDVARLLLTLLADSSFAGPVNATAPFPVSHGAFMRALGTRLQRPLLPVPGALTAAAARLLMGEMAGPMLLEGAEVLPRKALDHGFAFTFPTVDQALADLYP